MIQWLFNQTSQALGVLAFVGSLAAVYRWDKAVRRDFLLAFIMFMIGTSLREGVVYHWGNNQWGELPLIMSALARGLQLIGAVLFIRYATKDVCPMWGMMVFLGVVMCFVLIL